MLGRPDKKFLKKLLHCGAEGRAVDILLNVPKEKKKGKFEKVFAECDPVAVDLLTKLLRYDPDKRYSIDKCFAHPFMKDLY